MTKKMSLFLMVFVVAFSLLALGASHAGMKHEGAAGMKMHHLHLMMNHGLQMVMEGSNLVMLGEMKMAPGVDTVSLDHGRKMITNGKALIERFLSGPEMMVMMKGTHADSPGMKYTHELGEAMLKAVDHVEKMATQEVSKDMMGMHHMHIMLNHALAMAAEGANIRMIGQMGMAGSVDEFSIEHGDKMLVSARTLYRGVMESKEMKAMHGRGVSPEKDPMMGHTHKMAETYLKIIDLLGSMQGAK